MRVRARVGVRVRVGARVRLTLEVEGRSAAAQFGSTTKLPSTKLPMAGAARSAPGEG